MPEDETDLAALDARLLGLVPVLEVQQEREATHAAFDEAFRADQARDRRLDELEALRDQDYHRFMREGGGDELLKLLRSE